MSAFTILKERFQNFGKILNETAAQEYKIIALDALALMKRRIINTGTDATGQKFPLYSDAVVPFWFFRNKEGVSQNDLDKLVARGYFVSYKDLREVKGRPTNMKNFSFTGKMWSTLESYVESAGNGIIVIAYKASSDREDIVNIHDDQYNLLDLSQEERQLIKDAVLDRLDRAARKAGLK